MSVETSFRAHAAYITSAEQYQRRFGRKVTAPGFSRAGWYDLADGWARPQEPDKPIAAPMIIHDVADYVSPVGGGMITSRSQRREDFKRSGCVPAEPLTNRPRGVGNPRMAKKYGVKLDEDAQHRKRPQRIDPLAELKNRR